MKITYFPFTSLPLESAGALNAFFKDVTMLSLETGPESSSSDSGISRACLPDERMKALLAREKAYLSWASLHQGNEKNLKHLLKSEPYFTSDTDLTAIRSQIRTQTGAQGGGQAGGATDRQASNFSDPFLFLKLADNFDRETMAIEDRLLALDENQQAFMDELKGEPGGRKVPDRTPSRRSDPGETMPGERIRAWATAAREAGMLEDSPGILVTTSSGVMDYILANAKEVRNGLDINPIKVHEDGCASKAGWLQDFEKILDQFIDGTPFDREDKLGRAVSCCKMSGRIKACLLSGGQGEELMNIPGNPLVVCLVQLNS